jgi:D-sedoheptulose 7-phosphate isomerase
MENIDDIIKRIFRESIQIKETFLRDHLDRIVRVVDVITEALKKGNKILLFGNGGSAADAQHIAGNS